MKGIVKTTLWTTMALYGMHRLNQRISRNVPAIHDREEDRVYTWSEGNILFQQTGSGQPVLFLHGIGSGCSSFEWYKNIPEYANHFRCYAFDWLGFGRSDKPNIHYTPHLYIQLIRDFIRDVIGEPAFIIANSFSAAYAIKLAADDPHIVKGLIVICPSGLALQQQKENPVAQFIKSAVLHAPILKTSAYYLIASKLHIRQFLLQYLYLYPENVTEQLVDMYYEAAHFRGKEASYAPNAFLSGKLDIVIDAEWMKLSTPALIVWGKHAQIYPVTHAAHFKRLKPSCSIYVFTDSGLMPHDEEADRFNKLGISFFNHLT